jgi:DNA mismatch repair protein MutH
MVTPPATIDELLGRAGTLRGRTVAELADQLDVRLPGDARYAKGWVGQLVEAALGATSGSKAEPDFPGIGVELKTIPVGADGRPRESTYVCTVPEDAAAWASWPTAWARRKLDRVLFLPVGPGEIAVRRFGAAVLWSPDAHQDALLEADWLGFREAIMLGERWLLDGRQGKALQIRPKAADRTVARWVQDDEAAWVRSAPLGFYLRPGFTRSILSS